MNLYTILGVDKNASHSQIKKAYYKLAKKFHPDKGNGADIERFKEISKAYDVLGDEEKRKTYDETGTIPGSEFTNRSWAIGQLSVMFEKWIKNRLDNRTKMSFPKYAERELVKKKKEIKDMLDEICKKQQHISLYNGIAEVDDGEENIFQNVIDRLTAELIEIKSEAQISLERTITLFKEMEKYKFKKMDGDDPNNERTRNAIFTPEDMMNIIKTFSS